MRSVLEKARCIFATRNEASTSDWAAVENVEYPKQQIADLPSVSMEW